MHYTAAQGTSKHCAPLAANRWNGPVVLSSSSRKIDGSEGTRSACNSGMEAQERNGRMDLMCAKGGGGHK